MLKRVSGHLTYANVMATVAVFIVLGGGAYALSNRDRREIKQIARNLDEKIALTPGPKGEKGDRGEVGPKGDQGPPGPAPIVAHVDVPSSRSGPVFQTIIEIPGLGRLLGTCPQNGQGFLNAETRFENTSAGRVDVHVQREAGEEYEEVLPTASTYIVSGRAVQILLSSQNENDPTVANVMLGAHNPVSAPVGQGTCTFSAIAVTG